MAGIGFELKKMFKKKGLLSLMRAYGYAGIVCVGPMLLGILLLLGIRILAGIGGASELEKELLNCMVTDTLLFSLILTNIFSLVSTRFIADQLYLQNMKKIMPSFWGNVTTILLLGSGLFGGFLACSGISFLYKVLCFILFEELVLVWIEINYLTAIKDYRGIILTFFVAMLMAWGSGYTLLLLDLEPSVAMLIGVCIGYGVMAVWYYVLLARYFPTGRGSSFQFLQWFDRYPQLAVIGVSISVGLFGHLIIMWFSPIGKQIQGLFYTAASYEVPALFAFLSILITTINFVTSVEVNFYPKYRNYFSLFNDGGSLLDIEQAEKEMRNTLFLELVYTYTKQAFATIVFIIGGTFLLPLLPLGMTEEMLGIYRILCVAYAFYAIGNCTMLIQLYFVDHNGAMISTLCFMVISCLFTILFAQGDITGYGLGFLIGSISFALLTLIQLYFFLKKLIFHVLCKQPIVEEVRRTWVTNLSEQLENAYQRRKKEE